MAIENKIRDHISGDSVSITRSYLIVPATTGIMNKCYFTIKENNERDDDSEAIVQNVITTSLNADGQITAADISTTVNMFFLLPHTKTSLIVPNKIYYYDIKTILVSGAPHTFEKGTLMFDRGTTRASS